MGSISGENYIIAYSGDRIDGILSKANTYPAATEQDAGKVPTVQNDGTIGWGGGGVEIPDDNDPTTKFKLGIEDGALYIQLVE